MFQRSRAGFYEFVIFPVGGSIFYFDKSVRYKTRCKFLFCHWFLCLNMTTPLMKSLTMVCQSGATTTRTLCNCISNHYYEYTMREARRLKQISTSAYFSDTTCDVAMPKLQKGQHSNDSYPPYAITPARTGWNVIDFPLEGYVTNTHGQTFEESTFKQ